MSADLWMGIAIGSLGPLTLLILILRGRSGMTEEQKRQQEIPNLLLQRRNEIGILQVKTLQEIQYRLEGIFGRMPEPEPDQIQLAAPSGDKDQAVWLLEEFINEIEEPPDRNCSCHINAPCCDCVDHSHMRELFQQARALIAKRKEGA